VSCHDSEILVDTTIRNNINRVSNTIKITLRNKKKDGYTYSGICKLKRHGDTNRFMSCKMDGTSELGLINARETLDK
jgi:hypothetical protein